MVNPNATEKLRDAIRTSAADPLAFEEFLEAWNGYFQSEISAVHDLEEDAQTALATIAKGGEHGLAGLQITRMLHAFPTPAIVVRSDARILEQNAAALEALHVDPGDSIDLLPLSLVGGAALSDVVGQMFDRRNDPVDVRFLRAVYVPDDRSVTLAMVSNQERQAATALVFVIDPRWQSNVDALLAQAFGLTSAESAVLLAFMQGDDLQQIAETRGRSLKTVRTQMQTIMSKAGVSTQAELMRNALAVSQFQNDIQQVAVVAKHPHRKHLNILRAGGRSVEVGLAGDLAGDLVVFVPDTTLFMFQPEIEAAFARAGLCVATVSRPGFGATDPAPEGTFDATMAADIVAVQDQLGHSSSVLMAHSTSSGYAYRLGGLIPDRLKQIVLLSTLVPLPYLTPHLTTAPWAQALMRGAAASPRLFRLMVVAGAKAWKIMGSRRFVAMQMSANADDVSLGTSPAALEEIDAAMMACHAQGIDHGSRDLVIATSDWRNWAQACKAPVTLFHGTLDPVASIDAVRAFAADFPDQVRVVEIKDAGFMVYLSHTDALIAELKAAS